MLSKKKYCIFIYPFERCGGFYKGRLHSVALSFFVLFVCLSVCLAGWVSGLVGWFVGWLICLVSFLFCFGLAWFDLFWFGVVC